ncbi:PaaI family thioesterase [Gordonia sp. zg691]|uniref:PaaI family thioesterase n=1 Tax=Gordonia jinghuaiqii TaxID=2758710 RepID=UPI0016625E9B|nr:PaaI family thioesterase [Gordonia jinghuaiqii]MBD0861023.1 PaaI family thioesterase [Gordonia jinghuaiqii]
MSEPHDPLSAFHVGDISLSDARVQASQKLCARFLDHRGLIELPALAVLFDHLGGIPFHRVHDDPAAATLQARLSMSTLGRAEVGDLISGRAEVVMHDDAWGTTSVEIRTGGGRLSCVGTARNVRVGRAPTGTSPTSEIGTAVPECVDCRDVALPESIPSSMTGRAVVEEIATKMRAPGPLTQMLNGRVEVLDGAADRDTGIRFRSATDPWMGNMFGTMHGGVIATIVGQAASFAGQLHAAPGQTYSLGDMAIGFYRSPAVDGSEVIVEVTPIKAGRRISSFEATMRSYDDVLLSRATVDVHYA